MVPQQQRRRRRRVALPRSSERRVIVARGVGGFGFTIAGQRPCVVSAVAAGGPAELAGLRAGDALLAVDGAGVARAAHGAVARLVAAAPGPIALSVAPRDAPPPPTDTEDTDPDDRASTRRRHPPPRRRHHPACDGGPGASGVNEMVQSVNRALLAPSAGARRAAMLECRAVLGYLGTIETPLAAGPCAPGDVRTAVRKLRQERRPAAPVLLCVQPAAALLRRAAGQLLAQYRRDRILYAGCGSDADQRYFGLVTAAAPGAPGPASRSTHVFAVDARLAEHEAHAARAAHFRIACTRDPVAERCLEFPPSAEYVVGVIRGMYSLPADDCAASALRQISELAAGGGSPAGELGRFGNRAVVRAPRNGAGQDGAASSPQPSDHSEMTTTSSNSDSGIGFRNDCRNIADKILVVDFARQPPLDVSRPELAARPRGLAGCAGGEDGSFLSNTTPVVAGFDGQGSPLEAEDAAPAGPRAAPDTYNYNGPGRVPASGSHSRDRWRAEEAAPSAEWAWSAPAPAQPDESVPTEGSAPAHFLHPATLNYKVRKTINPLNILSKTKWILSGRGRAKASQEERRRAISASAGDVCAGEAGGAALPAAASEPDLRDAQSEQASPFRRWTTGGGAGGSYRQDQRLFNKQMSEAGAATGGGAEWRRGGVARWSLGLEQLLAEPAGAAAFAHFLAKEFAHENIRYSIKRFWWSCERYRGTEEAERREELAAHIWERHLVEGAPEPVNVDAAARRAAAARLAHRPPPHDLFQQAQKQIFTVMKFDSYPRFLRSAVHAECARADLRGLPPPYPADPPSDSPKLKKSASNASERRRSGASSLLPWRLRGASRERDAPAPAPAPASAPLLHMVGSGASAAQCSLCRVVLPDGATSVVGVEPALSVRRLVDRLLQRRNLLCAAYDVLLKDEQGACCVVEASSASTVLGGREALVERRCVVRMEVAGRCVAVRCRPARRLRHVLRPVLARYAASPGPGAGGGAARRALVLRDGQALHPDTTMQSLDGARLQVVEAGGAQEALDDDAGADSLSELALRLHADPSEEHQGASEGAGGVGGRVRAALRPGPPLHHHPPDFLDNLRETQRQRLQPASPPARAPPPLPPKPAPPPAPRSAPTAV